jgi:hypothetical protein
MRDPALSDSRLCGAAQNACPQAPSFAAEPIAKETAWGHLASAEFISTGFS